MSLSQLRSLSSSSESGPSERLTAEDEKSMARDIRKAEQIAREAIAGYDIAENILRRRPDRAERTRAVRREGDDHIDGIICASICVAGIHERHHEGGPRVSFGKVPHDAEINCKRQRKENMLIDHGTPLADLKADILVWHLWVRPEARGRGWSRRLIEAVVSVAADAIARGYPDIMAIFAREEEAALYHMNFCARLSADVLRFNQKGLDSWRHLLPQATEEHDEDIRLSSVLWTGAWRVKTKGADGRRRVEGYMYGREYSLSEVRSECRVVE